MPIPVAVKTSKPHLIEYLPAIYQEADPSHPQMFLGQFLLAFERVLLGQHGETADAQRVVGDKSADTAIEGLGEKIATLHRVFDPGETPEEFLPWLASWAALSFRAELSVPRRRRLLANIIPLYRIRGTRRYLEKLLELCVDAIVSVTDVEIPGLQLERHSTVGFDTYLGGGPPHFFSVTLVAPRLNQDQKDREVTIAHSIIELAKPAHTVYELSVASPRMEVGVHSTIGIDTVLGPPTAESA